MKLNSQEAEHTVETLFTDHITVWPKATGPPPCLRNELKSWTNHLRLSSLEDKGLSLLRAAVWKTWCLNSR